MAPCNAPTDNPATTSTVACSVARATTAPVTPTTFSNDFVTGASHEAPVMPLIASETVATGTS
jgi:hypothetical protein